MVLSYSQWPALSSWNTQFSWNIAVTLYVMETFVRRYYHFAVLPRPLQSLALINYSWLHSCWSQISHLWIAWAAPYPLAWWITGDCIHIEVRFHTPEQREQMASHWQSLPESEEGILCGVLEILYTNSLGRYMCKWSGICGFVAIPAKWISYWYSRSVFTFSLALVFLLLNAAKAGRALLAAACVCSQFCLKSSLQKWAPCRPLCCLWSLMSPLIQFIMASG